MFLFIGEAHQALHALPIAAEMQALAPDVELEVAVASDAHGWVLDLVRSAYPGFAPKVKKLAIPALSAVQKRLNGADDPPRLLTLLRHIGYLRGFDAIVVPERTTTIVRHFLSGRTRLIFTPHGAGDKAIMLDPRDRFFDFVLVAGEKSEKRLLEAGTITPGRYAVNGYVKLDFMQKMARHRPPLFDNDRPTVLYAPHFRPDQSSWETMGRDIIAAFAAQDRFNLVVAPHIRLFHRVSKAAKAKIEAMAVPGKIIVDTGSNRLVDMTYTGGADIYLGDVSSQVYEFLATPRPCVFLNAHGAQWQGDPNFLFWTLGEVADTVPAAMAAIERAGSEHPRYSALQAQALALSVGGDPAGAARRGAEAILRYLRPAG
ncbi:hypothetical protein OOT33_08540 [Sphingobium sp. DEHP117]|uniref:hypothetical protein n=1 Tax=Sphingobium sp. DEHP117 TaxID=2993436 RepID=UPI0027D68BF7|nr:hypothetical protein [Sphingobium sp. DEHP117]MDQ4420476.1 hypothetical protein [Sphingobium sp. DEHP117]